MVTKINENEDASAGAAKEKGNTFSLFRAIKESALVKDNAFLMGKHSINCCSLKWLKDKLLKCLMLPMLAGAAYGSLAISRSLSFNLCFSICFLFLKKEGF